MSRLAGASKPIGVFDSGIGGPDGAEGARFGNPGRDVHLSRRHRSPALRHEDGGDGDALFGAGGGEARELRHQGARRRLQHGLGCRAAGDSREAGRVAGNRRDRSGCRCGVQSFALGAHRGDRDRGHGAGRCVSGGHPASPAGCESERASRAGVRVAGGRGMHEGRLPRRWRITTSTAIFDPPGATPAAFPVRRIRSFSAARISRCWRARFARGGRARPFASWTRRRRRRRAFGSSLPARAPARGHGAHHGALPGDRWSRSGSPGWAPGSSARRCRPRTWSSSTSSGAGRASAPPAVIFPPACRIARPPFVVRANGGRLHANFDCHISRRHRHCLRARWARVRRSSSWTARSCSRAFGPMPKLAPLLAERFRVYMYDRRGRGASADTQPYTKQREVEDLEALIGEAGGSANVLGLSSRRGPCARGRWRAGSPSRSWRCTSRRTWFRLKTARATRRRLTRHISRG